LRSVLRFTSLPFRNANEIDIIEILFNEWQQNSGLLAAAFDIEIDPLIFSHQYAVKSARFVHSSGGDGNAAKVNFPKSTLETDERVVVTERQTGLPIKGRAYAATLEDGTVVSGKTDEQGRTELVKSPDMSRVLFTFEKE